MRSFPFMNLGILLKPECQVKVICPPLSVSSIFLSLLGRISTKVLCTPLVTLPFIDIIYSISCPFLFYTFISSSKVELENASEAATILITHKHSYLTLSFFTTHASCLHQIQKISIHVKENQAKEAFLLSHSLVRSGAYFHEYTYRSMLTWLGTNSKDNVFVLHSYLYATNGYACYYFENISGNA